MRIPLTHYGWREMAAATVVFGALTVCGALLYWPAAVLPAALWAYVVLFFRDPQRTPEAEGAFLSPADGRVADIAPVGPDGPLGTEGTRIGVFMDVFDVHVNRSPCSGRVAGIEHRDGGYVDARRPEASDRNESATILLACDGPAGPFPAAVRQVAGLIARRIVTDLRVGQELAPGERIGMVKFGSRVELIVPTDRVGRVAVQTGQKVRAGRTALIYPPTEEPRP